MIPLYSTRQIREVDNYAINQLYIPGIILMENAAIQIFNHSVNKFEELQLPVNKIGFVCGKGNNGGDGFAAARHFSNNGFNVIVIYTGNEKEFSADAAFNFNILKNLSAENKKIKLVKYSKIKDLNPLYKCDVVFDAILGTGSAGSLRLPYSEIINSLNKINCYKIAIDIPTGLNPDTGYGEEIFRSDFTISLAEFKKGLFFGSGKLNSGETVIGNIGINDDYFNRLSVNEYLIEPEDALENLPKKNKNINKYSSGKVFTIAGSASLPGAAILSSISTLRIGAGASVLFFPKSAKKFIHKRFLEIVVQDYQDNNTGILTEDNLEEIGSRIEWADVIAIGPGLGRNESTQNAVIKLINNRNNKRMVIDADAIFAISKGRYKNLDLHNCTLTPHHGEFANLIGISVSELQKDILKHGKDFSQGTGSYLVLKGAPTIIFTPSGDALINTSGNPGMAKFGSGDVLTGILSGLIAQQKLIESSVITGVYLHSLSADLLLKDFTEYSYTAEDIINNIAKAIKFLRNSLA